MLSLCQCERRAEARQELARVSFALDRLRAAPNSRKAPELEALRATHCKRAEVCRLRDHCAEAYVLHLRALENSSTARQALAEPATPGSPRALELADLLGSAEHLLESARKRTVECAEEQAILTTRYAH
jgi:hypothetical protein